MKPKGDMFTERRLAIIGAIVSDPHVRPYAARVGAHLLLNYASRASFATRGVIEAWPSQQTVAYETGGTVESVRRAKAELARYMTVRIGNGRTVSSVYTFALPADYVPRKAPKNVGLSDVKPPRNPHPSAEGNPHTAPAETPTQPADKPPHGPATNPLREPSEVEPIESRATQLVLIQEPSSCEASRSEAFERWWAMYPSKVGKKPSRAKFLAVVRSGEASLDELMQGLDRYCQSDKVVRGIICNPMTWLNQGRWSDEPASGASSGGFSAVDQSLALIIGKERA